MFSALIDFFFPPRCPNCSAYVERRGDFCPTCAARLIGLRSIARTSEAADCLAGIWTLGHYREGVRDLLRALKYQKRKYVLPDLQALLREGEEVLALLPRPLTAVAVPLSRARIQERGFNQTEEIFAPWLRAHDINLVPLLVRTRATAPLYDHTRAERRRELRGAFAVAAGADVAGRDIDDGGDADGVRPYAETGRGAQRVCARPHQRTLLSVQYACKERQKVL